MTGIYSTLILSVFMVVLLSTTIPSSFRLTPSSKKTPAVRSSCQNLKFPYEYLSAQTLAAGDPHVAQSIAAFQKLVIDNYVSWHTRTRASYEAARVKGRLIKPPRLLVVRSDLSLTHGLGDRFRGIVTAYFLAVLSRRLFLIDWRAPIPLSLAFVSPSEANFTYDETLAPHYPFNDSFVVQGNYYHMSDYYKTNVTTLFLDSVPKPNVTRWFNPPERRRRDNWLLNRLAKYKELEPCVVIPLIFRALFRPTPLLRTTLGHRINQRQMKALKISDGTPFMAIHARLGYGLGEIQTDSGRFDLQRSGTSMLGMARCFVDAVAAHVEWSTPSSEPRVFLATDTPEFRPLVSTELAKRVPKAHLVSMDADVKHVRDLSAKTQKDIDSFMDTFVDVFLLSSASVLFNLRSGFSDLAVWMGATCRQHLITYEHCSNKFGNITDLRVDHDLTSS